MHMRLYADYIDTNPGRQTVLDKFFIIGGYIIIVNQERSVGIHLPCLDKYLLYKLDASEMLTQSYNRVLRLIKYRHDHDFVYHVPDFNQSGKISHIALDARQLLL